MKKPRTAIQAAHLFAAIRALDQAESDLLSAGETLAAMRVGAVRAGVK